MFYQLIKFSSDQQLLLFTVACSGTPSGIFSPLQWGLWLGECGGPLLVPATVVHRGADFLEGGGVVGQHETPLGGRALGGTRGSGGLRKQSYVEYECSIICML